MEVVVKKREKEERRHLNFVSYFTSVVKREGRYEHKYKRKESTENSRQQTTTLSRGT
jgi:hypothetical protein